MSLCRWLPGRDCRALLHKFLEPLVSDPVGTVSFPCQVPEISCADAEEDKNSPVNNPVIIVAM